jgi:hypothetical protein
MVTLLAEIAEKTINSSINEFFERGELRALAAELKAMPSDGDTGRRLQLNFLLGWHYLRLGEVDSAVKHYLVAHRLLDLIKHRVPAEQISQAAFDTGIAFMRLGEVQNRALIHNADHCLLPIHESGVHQLQEGSRNATRYFTEVLEDPAGPPRDQTQGEVAAQHRLHDPGRIPRWRA